MEKKRNFSKFNIFCETKKGKKYYYGVRSRREKINPKDEGKVKGSGKSKVITEKIYLGACSSIMKKLFEAKKSPQKVYSKEYGLPMCILKAAEQINLIKIIDEVLPYKVKGIRASEFILVSAISKLNGSISKEKTGDYINKTVLPEKIGIKSGDLNSKTYWSMFEKIISEKEIKIKKKKKGYELNEKLTVEKLEELIDDHKLEEIEEKIWANLLDKHNIFLDLLLYDGTNYFTYYQDHTANSYGQKGKNKKGRHTLRQIGMFVAVTGDGFPFLSQLACGNIHDATMFPCAMKKLIARYHKLMGEAKKIRLAFDKGNNSKKNLAAINNNEYIGALAPSSYKDLSLIPLEKYLLSYKNFVAFETTKDTLGAVHKIFITYNESLMKKQQNTFNRHKCKIIDSLHKEYKNNKTEEDIEERLKNILHNNKILYSRAIRYLNYKIKNNKIIITEDKEEIQNKNKEFGKNIIFTNNLEADYLTTIQTYKEKQKVEDSFKTIKDHRIISAHPIWHWTDSKIRIDAFISVLAYLLIKLLQYLAKKDGLDMSEKSLITALKGIRESFLIYNDETAEKKLEEMPPLQKQLLHIFGVADQS